MDNACLVKVPGHAALQTGDKIALSIPSQQLHVFDQNGQALERSLSDDELKAWV
jgi:multiple sugar transport system ATP-binding protein